MPGVIRLLLPDTKIEGEEEREALKDAVLANTAQLQDLDRVPLVHCCTLFLCYQDAEIGYRVVTPYRRM